MDLHTSIIIVDCSFISILDRVQSLEVLSRGQCWHAIRNTWTVTPSWAQKERSSPLDTEHDGSGSTPLRDFEVGEGGIEMHLKKSTDEARKLVLSIPHKTCARAIEENWKVGPDGSVRAQSVLWLFCWAKTGMNSEHARKVALRVFDEIMPIAFAEFDAAVDHQYARISRYAAHSIETELGDILSAHGLRSSDQ
jgi:hypothetical protein